MKRVSGLLLAVGLTFVLSGCASTQLVGTWKGQEADPGSTFSFAAVTFANDGTYTAQMKYKEQMRADSGHWEVEDGQLVLDEGQRSYEISFDGKNVLQVKDPKSGHAVMLKRFH